MTSAGPTLFEGALPAETHRSRYARELVEFLLVGGATLFMFPLCWVLRAWLGADMSELVVAFSAFYAAWLINDPHFTVTYVLFYEKLRARAFGDVYGRVQKIRYWIAGFVVPVVLAAWGGYAIAARSAYALGLMIQLMFALVGWHYVKQGFGVLAVLSARRGVSLGPTERKAFLAHCFAAWLYAWASPADAGNLVEEKGVVYRSIAHGRTLELVTLGIFVASALVLAGVLFRAWRERRRLPPLVPLSGFLITVWVWTVFTSLDPLMIYLIPGMHSVQYLYFVWLLRRNEARAHESAPFFGRPVKTALGVLAASSLALGVLAFHALPSALDGALVPAGRRGIAEMGELGVTPYFAWLFVFLNVHHYFMDHVIWRREHPETRYLVA